MADGKVVIQVDMDGNKAQSGVARLKGMVGGLAESGMQLGSVFKSVLGANIVSGALISGIQSLGSAIKGVFATALDEGAKLQQSFGGVDTLYTTAAESVKQYANAAAAAGISANTYAEQAVSFGASLKQALGGDAVKAAQMADKAIMAMADNSAKMGTDIGSIQQTFQGFAKQNYTMLDNLKLGYGGTKEEMQRLLKDASKLERAMGKKFDINNFADIVEAIDLVQQELGVAGVAAQEAQTTFSGSFAAMKASASNFLANLTLGEDIGPSLKALISSTSTFLLGNFLPMVGNIMRQLPQAVETALAEAGPKIEQGFKSLFASLGVDEGVFDVIKDTFRDVVVTIQSLFEELTSESNGFGNVIQGVGNVIQTVNVIIQNMAMAFQFALEAFSETGAIKNAYQAFKDLTDAALDLAVKLGDAIPWDIVGAAAGHVVNAISMIVSWISKLSQSISGDIWKGLITGIGGALVAFKAFNFLKSFNPFGLFAKGAKEGADEVVKGATKSKSLVSQIFSGLSNVIKSSGTAIKTAATGIGQGIKIALSGLAPVIKAFGAALKTAGMGNILALGGAVAIAAVGIGAGIAIIAAGLSLIASQGEGVATIINAVGQAFATVATAIISTFAQAIVTVSGVLPNVTSALAQLSPLVVAFGEAMGAAAPFITALGEAISGIATAVTPIVEIISNAFVSVAQIIADTIVQIVEAIAPFAPAITEMVVAIAPSIADIVSSFSDMFSQISPIIDSLTNLLKTFGEQVSSILESAGSVVESFGSAIRNVLDGVAGIFDSIGNAALNAGIGFKSLAEGVVMITNTGLADLSASLAATATGLGAIASQGAGLATAGQGMTMLSSGMMMFSQSTVVLQSTLTALPALLTSFTSSLTGLPDVLTSTVSSMIAFGSNVQSSLTGLTGLGSIVVQFNAMLMTIAPVTMMAGAGLESFNAQAGSANSALASLGASASTAQVSIVALGTGIQSAMSGATTGIATAGAQMVTAIQTAGTTMITSMQSTMAQIHAIVNNGMISIVQSVRNNGNQMVSAWTSVGQQLVTTTQGFVNSANNTLAQIGQGVNLYSNGAALMAGLKSGIDAGWSSITSSVSNMAAWIKAHKGPVSYDRKLLIENGAALMAGLNQGIQTGWRNVMSNISSMAGSIQDVIDSDYSDIGWQIGLGISDGLNSSIDNVTGRLDAIRDHVNDFSLKSKNLLTGATATMSSQLKVETLRGKTPKEEISSRQEAYIAHSTSLLSDVIDSLSELREQVAQGQTIVLDTGALVGGTAYAYDEAVGNIQTLRGRHRLS
ncbi:phage protein [Streptococcus pneumoniae]|nr:phage protein [Streptococcus pneumoniae]